MDDYGWPMAHKAGLTLDVAGDSSVLPDDIKEHLGGKGELWHHRWPVYWQCTDQIYVGEVYRNNLPCNVLIVLTISCWVHETHSSCLNHRHVCWSLHSQVQIPHPHGHKLVVSCLKESDHEHSSGTFVSRDCETFRYWVIWWTVPCHGLESLMSNLNGHKGVANVG